MEEQERAERAWCEANNADVVGVLSVPGESRAESDVLTIFEEFAEKGIFAYHDLRRMWQPPRQFDVLVAYHDSRLGRSEPLIAYVVVNVLNAGASIYNIIGGWYEPDEYQMKMFMSMASTTNEMKRFVALTKAKKLDRAQKGTLVHSHPCWAYKIERNDKGEPLRKVPDEKQRVLIEAAAQLVIEGVGWGVLERELAERYGFTHNDKPYNHNTFYRLFHNPNFYGHEVIGRINTRNERKPGFSDLWVFDRSYSPPDETQIFYEVLQPYLNDDLSERLKSELRRRRHAIHGGARPGDAHKFTGLLSCYYCGRNMMFHPANGGKNNYWMCQSKYTSIKDNRCDIVRMIRDDAVQAWLDTELNAAIQAHDPEWFLRRVNEESRADQLEHLKDNRAQTDQQFERALDAQLAADDDLVRQRMSQRSSEFSRQLQELDRQIASLESKHNLDVGGAKKAYELLAAYGDLPQFWADKENTVNQILHGLLGEQTLVIREKQVQGRAERT